MSATTSKGTTTMTTYAATDSDIATAIEDCKREILRDMANADVIAAPIFGFEDLHDHVDANEYGGFTDPQRRAHWSTDDMVRAHDAIDAWLSKGAESEPCEVCGCPSDLGDEPGEVQASSRWITVCSVACTEAAIAADPED
jgi:hypothetical protein